MDCTDLLKEVGYTGNFIKNVVVMNYYKREKNNRMSSKKNIFEIDRYHGLGRPIDKISTRYEYIRYMLNCFNGHYQYYSEDEDDDERREANENIFGDLLNLANILDEKVDTKNVVIHISYPLTNPANLMFTVNDDQNVTQCDLLYLHTIAYKLVYLIEESDDKDPGNIPGMLNRAKSYGRFGVWGHSLDDLVYNGGSSLDIYGSDSQYGEHVYFSAGCDS